MLIRIRNMANETRHRPRLTPKGERTRARIVAAAAALIHERGVAGTTLDDVRTAAEVSGSQLSHYFAGKDELVQAVIDHQADVIVGNQEQADLGTTEGIRAWRDMVIAAASSARRQGRLPPRVTGRPARRDRPRSPRPHRRRLRALVVRHRRRTAGPAVRRAPPGRRHPGRPRGDAARRPSGRAPPRPGPARHPPPRNRRRHHPRPRRDPVNPFGLFLIGDEVFHLGHPQLQTLM